MSTIGASNLTGYAESKSFSNISATTAAFKLTGGMYGITAKATWGGGSVTLQRMAADSTTYVSTGTVLSADGFTTATLPGGSYKFAVASATGIYVDITAVVTAREA